MKQADMSFQAVWNRTHPLGPLWIGNWIPEFLTAGDIISLDGVSITVPESGTYQIVMHKGRPGLFRPSSRLSSEFVVDDGGLIHRTKVDNQSDHSHGPVVCRECSRIVQPCVCLTKGQTEELIICVHCREEAAYQQTLRTQELNRELERLGVLYKPGKIKEDE